MIVLPSEIIHDKFQLPIPTRCRDMDCRLHQRPVPPPLPYPTQVIYFWNLHTIPFVHAKFQPILTTLNFQPAPSPTPHRFAWWRQDLDFQNPRIELCRGTNFCRDPSTWRGHRTIFVHIGGSGFEPRPSSPHPANAIMDDVIWKIITHCCRCTSSSFVM